MIHVHKVKLPSDSPLIQAANKMAPKLRQAFVDAIDAVKEQVDIDALTAAIETGDIDKIMDALDLSQTLSEAMAGKGVSSASVKTVLQQTFSAGADAALKSLPAKVSVGIAFDVMNPESVKAIQEYSFDLIQQVSQTTRDSVQQVVLRAFQDGGHPFEQAREIKSFIGLTPQMEQAVNNYKSMLQSGGASDLREALSRSLRDGRYDRTLLTALRSGQSLSTEKIDQMANRYRERYLQYRSKNIARTESIRAATKGQRELWRQAQDQGLIGKDPQRVWITGGNACPICEDLNGETAGLDEEFAPGITEPPDPHPSCECTVALDKESF